MRRYLLVALFIGAVSALTTLLLYQFGVFDAAGRRLSIFYANHGLMDGPKTPRAMGHYPVVILLAFAMSWCVIDIPRISHKSIVAIGLLLMICVTSVAPIVVHAAGDPLAAAGSRAFFFEPFSSLFAVTLSAVLGLIYSATEHGGRKRVLQAVLGGRISEKTFDQLLERERPSFLDGQNREITILTVRVFNHAQLRRNVEPADLIEMTNLFLRNTGEFLTSRGAYLDESSPDCVRVYFGVIAKDPGHTFQACDAALELRQRLTNLNIELESRYFQGLKWGIAISSDEMTMGIYQSETATRLSAVGEVVEFVRKLSAANSRYGSEILVSARTYKLIHETYAVRPMEMLFDSANDLMSEVYELVNLKSRLTEDDEKARQQFWKGVILYREGRGEDALAIFSELATEFPNDRPLAYFTDRAQSNMVDAPRDDKDVDAHLMHGHARVLHTL